MNGWNLPSVDLELHLIIICKKNLVMNSPYLKIHSNHQKQNLLRMEKVFVDALSLYISVINDDNLPVSGIHFPARKKCWD